MTPSTKPRRIRDPRLDPKPGDVVRNRKFDLTISASRTVVDVICGMFIVFSYGRGNYIDKMPLADWREFGRGAEVVKRAKAAR